MQFDFTKTHKSRPTVSMMNLNTAACCEENETVELSSPSWNRRVQRDCFGLQVEAESAATRGFVVAMAASTHSEQS